MTDQLAGIDRRLKRLDDERNIARSSPHTVHWWTPATPRRMADRQPHRAGIGWNRGRS